MSTGLTIPLVLWGPKAPNSRIIQISSVQNGKVIVTGSTDGQVMLWIVNESLGWIQPQMMLLAHETAITCMSPTSTSLSTSKFVTTSEDGHICLWDSIDGRIIDSLRTNYIHRRIKPYASNNTPQEVLICVGDYSDVIILHPHDLSVLYTLNSQAEPDWITSITLVQPTENHDVLIGVTMSGIAKLWSLRDLNFNENTTNVLFEKESKFIASRNVRAIACSERNIRMMLVVCRNSWQIIDPSNFNQLVISECAIEALEGIIIDIDKVAIGFADSTIVLFQLPRSKLTGKQVRERFGEKPINVANIDQPFVFALLKGVAPSPKPTLNPVKFYFDSKFTTDSRTHRRIVYRVDDHGSISFWHVPKNLELLVSEFVRTRRPIVYEPTIKQSLAEAWARLTPTPPSITEIEEGRYITATVYVATQGKLFLGRDDGSIMIMNACHAIMVSLLDGFGNDSAPYRLLRNGHTAAVKCFLYPYNENTRYDPNMLLSGGADFSVVVWNVSVGELIHRFCCQGGPIIRILVPPPNSSARILNCVCSIASDNSACLLSLKELKCLLLASRQQFPIIDVRWRPLDDFLLLRCEDDSVYVWQIETGNLDRIITGLVADEIMEACSEQFGINYDDTEDEAGASQAVQMIRALKHKNVAAFRKIAGHDDGKLGDNQTFSPAINLVPPIDIIQLKNCSDATHLILFNVDALISGLLYLDYEVYSSDVSNGQLPVEHAVNPLVDARISINEFKTQQNGGYFSYRDVTSSVVSTEKTATTPSFQSKSMQSPSNLASLIQQHSLYMDTAKLLISLLHAWDVDEDVDIICRDKLKLSAPRIPLCFGTASKGHVSLYTPHSSGKIPALDDSSFKYFSRSIHWQSSRALTTIHLLAVVALSNTLMAIRNRAYQLSSKKTPLKRALSIKSSDEQMSENESQQVKQGWSSIAALHCVLLPDLIKPRNSYALPRIDLLARKWQDSCIEIRDAAQALLIGELNRIGIDGRQQMIENWANFLPTQLDPSISIFGANLTISSVNNNNTLPPGNHVSHHHLPGSYIANSKESTTSSFPASTSPAASTIKGVASASQIISINPNAKSEPFSKTPPPRPSVPPIPPRSANSTPLPSILNFNENDSTKSSGSVGKLNMTSATDMESNANTTLVATSNLSLDEPENSTAFALQIQTANRLNCEGVNQIRKNQATAIIVLGVIGAEFASELQAHLDICRATAHSLLQLLLTTETPFVPVPQNSLLRRAAIDLLGRGFVIWQPHLDLSKLLIGLLNLAAECENHLSANNLYFGAQLTPQADACRTARHALSLIASARPQALITALNMEVVRYNAVVQHQTIQHPLASPLMKSRNEVLRLLEQLSDKQYNFVVDLIVPVGDILVHCLDLSLLKQRSIAELFPPIARFYMVAYCGSTRRLAFGGKNGVIVIHELRASKAQSVKAHNVPITALAFSQDGKYLAAYAAQEAKISFWQTQQTFLGMGQNQIRCAKTLPAPGEFPVISPGGSYQPFRARLVWINSKSLTLMLPNGKENRFSV